MGTPNFIWKKIPGKQFAVDYFLDTCWEVVPNAGDVLLVLSRLQAHSTAQNFWRGTIAQSDKRTGKRVFNNLWKATLLSPCLVLWPNRSSTIGTTQDVRGCQIKKILWTTQGRVFLCQSLANTPWLRYPSYPGFIWQENHPFGNVCICWSTMNSYSDIEFADLTSVKSYIHLIRLALSRLSCLTELTSTGILWHSHALDVKIQ